MKKLSIVLITLALITLFSCNVEGVTKPESNTTLPINKEQFTGDLTWQLQVTSISDLVTLPSQGGSFTWKDINDLSKDEKNILLENLTSGYWKIEVRGKDSEGKIKFEGELIVSFNSNQRFDSLPAIELPIKDHVHTPDTVWSSDEESHWHKCLICGEKLDLAPHDFVFKYDQKEHWKECSICGHEKAGSREEHNLEVTYVYDREKNILTIATVCVDNCGYRKDSSVDGSQTPTIYQLESRSNMEVSSLSHTKWELKAINRISETSTLKWLVDSKPLSEYMEDKDIELNEEADSLILTINTIPESKELKVECQEKSSEGFRSHTVVIKFS